MALAKGGKRALIRCHVERRFKLNTNNVDADVAAGIAKPVSLLRTVSRSVERYPEREQN
jgi:hypothetical protein